MFGSWIHEKHPNDKLYWIKHHNAVPFQVSVKTLFRLVYSEGEMTDPADAISVSTGVLATYEIIPVRSFWRRGHGETVASIHGKSS